MVYDNCDTFCINRKYFEKNKFIYLVSLRYCKIKFMLYFISTICPLISASGFCSVWKLTYVLSFFIAFIKSDTFFPCIGPTKSLLVKNPFWPTSSWGEEKLNRVTMTGPFSPWAPLCIWPWVAPWIPVAFT